MFETERFIEACREAMKDPDTRAIKEVVQRAVSEPGQIVKTLGEPKRAGIGTLHQSDDLTVLNIIWGPGMTLHPHDHRMLAIIGLYGGQENNTFYKRSESGLSEQGGKELHSKETVVLGDAVIHAVTNPLDELTGAIHVYSGDFFATPRSEWDPETLEEHPYDVEHTLRVFEESNKGLED